MGRATSPRVPPMSSYLRPPVHQPSLDFVLWVCFAPRQSGSVEPMESMGSNTEDVFLSGVVFGFCVGTASISYAVRRGAQFLDVGVLVCPDEAVNLSQRREFRRRRRRLRSRKARRQWFDRELSALGLTPPIAPHPDPPLGCASAPSEARSSLRKSCMAH